MISLRPKSFHCLKQALRALFFIYAASFCFSTAAFAQFVAPSVRAGWTYYHDLEIGTIGGYSLRMELVAPDAPPSSPLPVLVYIHGGGWNHGSKDAQATRIAGIANRGYVAAAITYRFAPTYAYPAQIEDVLAAVRFLKVHASTYHLDPDRINLWGTSAGGHLASLAGTAANDITYNTNGLWEGADNSVFSVVDFSGPNSNFLTSKGNDNSSLTAFLGAPSLSVPDRATEAMPISHVDAEDPPFFVAHGDADTTVLVHWSRDFVAALDAAGGLVEYHEFAGATHDIGGTHPESADLAYAFLRRVNFPEIKAFPVCEIENWVLLVSNGDRTSVGSDASASGGAHVYFKANAPGDWVDVELGVIPAGTYQISVSGKTHSARGIWQLSIGGTNIGLPVDQYSESTSAFTKIDLGEWVWDGGAALARFTVTGQNPASTDYQLSLDVLEFTPLVMDTWSGFPVLNTDGEYRYVDTGGFLGPIWVLYDWVFSMQLNRWMYLPESYIIPSQGTWAFIYSQVSP
jgi:acetyl esterase/lipase